MKQQHLGAPAAQLDWIICSQETHQHNHSALCNTFRSIFLAVHFLKLLNLTVKRNYSDFRHLTAASVCHGYRWRGLAAFPAPH